jgi:3'(2'), 5'-bisphosphate nucleotidase
VESVEKGHSSHDRMARARTAAGIPEELVERADSQEKYARLAKGDAELYLRLTRVNSTRPHMVWDHGPGTALVRAAGGRCTDLDGSPLDFSLGPTLAKNQGIIATNGPIHDHVIEAVRQLLAEEA